MPDQLVNFEDAAPTNSHQYKSVVHTVIPMVSSSLTLRRLTPQAVKPDQDWTWQDVRDYVVSEIERIHGPFPRNTNKETGIFKSFASRWGVQAPAIARCAFDVHGGMWRGAPIGVERFCIGSDLYFSKPILEALGAIGAR